MEEEGCSYYLVDHDTQTTFYLDETDTACLDLPDVCSMDHLSVFSFFLTICNNCLIWSSELLLEEQYWIHLEYFPMHKSLPSFAQSSIIGILTHAWGGMSSPSFDDVSAPGLIKKEDQSTSSLSTAPYSAEKCKEFILMIEKLTGR
jgi:hypothetical protein